MMGICLSLFNSNKYLSNKSLNTKLSINKLDTNTSINSNTNINVNNLDINTTINSNTNTIPIILESSNNKMNHATFDSLFPSKIRVIEWKDTIPFVAPVFGGRVIKVYDGDTIIIASKLPYEASPLYRFSVRLNGIDTPEIKSKNNEEKIAAINVRKILSELILHKYVRLENIQTEKYGRILADVYIENLHINKYLLDNKYAVPYDGGKKIMPENWLDYMKNVPSAHNTNIQL
jgi:endonuclease YncB( thermonuclease family)